MARLVANVMMIGVNWVKNPWNRGKNDSSARNIGLNRTFDAWLRSCMSPWESPSDWNRWRGLLLTLWKLACTHIQVLNVMSVKWWLRVQYFSKPEIWRTKRFPKASLMILDWPEQEARCLSELMMNGVGVHEKLPFRLQHGGMGVSPVVRTMSRLMARGWCLWRCAHSLYYVHP